MIQNRNVFETVLCKIDVYMKKYILPCFDPSKIYWWFSLSGGKDSFTMAHAINEWYRRNNYTFQGEGFCISQWIENPMYSFLCKQIAWMPVTIIDGINLSKKTLNYVPGEQAPCRACSSIRKSIGDSYIIDHYKDGFINIIARGLHLSDMAISYLWRVFWDIDIDSFSTNLEKGNPLVKLDLQHLIYLAKPLSFVREYETQEYSKLMGYYSICCGCPACRYPSRRDIIEESLRLLFTSAKWEFDVYGIRKYVSLISDGAPIEEMSLAGIETKNAHMPAEFFDYVLKLFRNKSYQNHNKATLYLDDIGVNYITRHRKNYSSSILQAKFDSDIMLTASEKAIIATVGPYWGCIGYGDKSMRHYLIKQQKERYNFQIDYLWSQVIPLLNDFYAQTHTDSNMCCMCNNNLLISN